MTGPGQRDPEARFDRPRSNDGLAFPFVYLGIFLVAAVAGGLLGRKSGRGFYRHPDDGSTARRKSSVPVKSSRLGSAWRRAGGVPELYSGL